MTLFRPSAFNFILLLLVVSRACAQTATMSAGASTYPATAGQITLNVSINYASVAAPTALGFTIELPSGWSYASTAGANLPDIRPRVGDVGTLEFAFTSPPSGAAAFAVVVSHPAGLSGSQVIRSSGIYRTPFRSLSVADLLFTLDAGTPVITRQPVGASVVAGQSIAFSVEASGPPVLTYQWRRDGVAIAGATASSLNIGAVSSAAAGSYTVVVSNSGGSVTSQSAALTVAAAAVAPAITVQPVPVSAASGGSATFAVTVAGTAPFSFQWRKDGVALPGATEATLLVSPVSSSSAGGYSVAISNSAGGVTSAAASLLVTSVASAPAITAQPVSQAVVSGNSVTLSVVATGSAPLAYQWRKDGAAIAGATRENLLLSSVSSSSAGSYSVTISNSAGSVTSSPATVSLETSSALAGAAFGTIAGEAGSFAMWVRADRTVVFLGFLREGGRALLNRSAEIGADGRFQFPVELFPVGGAVSGVSGVLSRDGSVSGVLTGTGVAISAPARAAAAVTSAFAGYYAAGEPNGSSIAHTIVGAGGESYVLLVADSGVEAARGSAGPDGAIAATTGASSIAGSVQRDNAVVVLSARKSASVATSFVGANDERRTVREKLLNISTRSDTTGAEGNALIAGFVLGGTVPKRVLVRAIGPSLAPFGVAGALPAARLELFRGRTSLAVSNDWGGATGASAVAAAAARLGAFPLDSNSRDAAVLVELAPGAYTAVVTGQGSAGGVGLVEVYDADETALAAQRIGNLASRGLAGSGDRTLTVGFVVGGSVPKRVLVRGVGPALNAFGVTGALADPRLEIFREGSVIGRNDNWEDGSAGGSISIASATVGAFALASGSRDAAIILNLFPGAYTAQLSGAGEQVGTALVEVYELP